jgi:hypothetical protein
MQNGVTCVTLSRITTTKVSWTMIVVRGEVDLDDRNIELLRNDPDCLRNRYKAVARTRSNGLTRITKADAAKQIDSSKSTQTIYVIATSSSSRVVGLLRCRFLFTHSLFRWLFLFQFQGFLLRLQVLVGGWLPWCSRSMRRCRVRRRLRRMRLFEA